MPLPVRIRENLELRCPHCDETLTEVTAVPLEARFGKRFAYGCPHCSRLLSISHRKGFWMG
jgi:hypothetical protein